MRPWSLLVSTPLPGQISALQATLPGSCDARRSVCRLHGGKGGGPKGERNGAYRTGHYTAEAKVERQASRVLLRQLRRLIGAGD